ncbi:MAG: hypothetical protein U9R00_00600 [Patescibacteria group bacterium]|nr:hypothetical protein [Patescibacteria group bacterium]
MENQENNQQYEDEELLLTEDEKKKLKKLKYKRWLLSFKIINYLLTLVLTFLIFIIIKPMFNEFFLVDLMGESYFLKLLFIILIFFIYETSKIKIKSLTRAEIMFLGTGTKIWLEEGVYFLWFGRFGLFTLREGETQDLEFRDVEITDFVCQDKNGKKLIVSFFGDFEIFNETIFRNFKEEEMQRNIEGLIRRALPRYLGKKIYEEEILGKNLSKEFIEDPQINDVSKKKYGIDLIASDLSILSGNMNQDDLNFFVKKLTKELKKSNPGMSNEEIAHQVNVKLGLTKDIKVKSNGNVLVDGR